MLGRLSLLAPLRHGHFRLLFAGQLVSNIGDWLNLLALVTLVLYRWDLGAPAWGAVLTALSLPAALLGPVAGVLADRWPRRATMVACDLARAGIVLGLVWAPNLPTVLALVGLASSFSALFFPAQRAAIRSTVPETDLLAASALSQFANYGARLVGPGLGGALVVLAGPRAAFVTDALTFIASAMMLSRLPPLLLTTSATGRDGSGHIWAEMREGLRYIGQRRIVLVGVGGTVALGFLAGATDALGTPVIKALGVDETMVGPSFTALGLGYVVAALGVGQVCQGLSPLVVLGLGMLGLGGLFVVHGAAVAVGLAGLLVALLAAYPARVLIGMGYGSSQVASAYVLQQQTPAALMGRVSATSRTLVTLIALPAPLLAAWLSERWGLGQTYAIAGFALAAAAGGVIVVRGWAEKGEQPADAEARPEPTTVTS